MDLGHIQKQAVATIMSTRLVQSIQQRDVTKSQYAAYLCDVYAYALHSSQVIALAGTRLALTHPPLAHYLFEHAAEELGHDRWAASDLRDLGMSEDTIRHLRPSSPCGRMIALEYFVAAHGNAAGLFGWLFVLESLGGKVGGGIADTLDRALGLEGKAVYFLRGHGEADAHHSADLNKVISENLKDEDDIAAFSRMAEESSDLYRAILDNAYGRREMPATWC
jgi:heme oxygenase